MNHLRIAGTTILCLSLGLISGCSKHKSVALTPRNGSATNPYQAGSPTDLSEYIRTVLKISQENTVAAEEKLAELHKRKPQLTTLIQVAGANARDTESRRLLAEAYFEAELLLHAFQLYQEIKTISPDDPVAELGMARIWETWGDYSLATQHAETAVKLDPKSATGLELLGKIYLRNNDLDAAISAFLSAINLEPENASLYANAGYIYLARGDFQPARAYLEQAVLREPFLPEAQNNLGITLGHLGDYNNALKAFTIANGRAAGLNNLGVIYMEQRRWKDASKAFQQALAIDPKHQKARKNLAEAEKRLPMPTVIELKPFEDNQNVVVNLKPKPSANRVPSPTISKGIEVIGGSVEIASKSVNSSSQNKAKRISVAFNDALARLKNRRYSEALEMFQWLIKQPANADTIRVCEYWIGECYWGMGNLAKARTAFSRVISYGDFAKRRDALMMLKRIANAERTNTKSVKG